MPKIDTCLDGQQFGRWIVLKTIPKYKKNVTYCLCKCECGIEKYVARCSLLSGKSQSCGCLFAEKVSNRCRSDHVGEMFGELIIIEMLYNYLNKERTYCRCICSCGNKCVVSLTNLTAGHTHSCGCKHGELTWDGRRTNLVGNVFGKLTVLEMLYNYCNNGKTYCKCVCECKNETIVDMQNLIHGRTESCGCGENKSILERFVSKILYDNNIDFISQKSFADCRDKNPLQFDFYIPIYNTCIECDGIQHFQPIKHFGGEEGLIDRKKKDEIKNKYCFNNDINLIRIPYTLSKDEIKNKIIHIWNP